MAIDNQTTKIQRDVLAVLNEHYRSFHAAKPFADRTGHTVPSDTKSFSEGLVSLLTGLPGRRRRKSYDLADGIRRQGREPLGRDRHAVVQRLRSRRAHDERIPQTNDVTALDDIPFLFFVLWDERARPTVP